MSPKSIVITVAAILVTLSFLTIALYVSSIGFGKIVPQGVRFSLTLLISYFLIQGSNVARWITIVLLGLGSVGSLIAGINSLSANPGMIYLIALGIIYLACTIALLIPPASRHFKAKPNTPS